MVGSGPAGLTCASDLAKKGYAVTVFEALHTAGGVLVYGIPEFRLPKAIVANEVKKLKAQGVEVMTNMVIGRVLSIDELFEMGYKAVFVGSGAGLPMFMHIPGEALKGVYSANEYLTRTNLMKAYTEEADTPIIRTQGCGRGGRRQRGHGRAPAAPCAWGQSTCTSSTAGARRRCPPGRKSSTTPRKRALSSRLCATLWKSWAMRTAGCAA